MFFRLFTIKGGIDFAPQLWSTYETDHPLSPEVVYGVLCARYGKGVAPAGLSCRIRMLTYRKDLKSNVSYSALRDSNDPSEFTKLKSCSSYRFCVNELFRVELESEKMIHAICVVPCEGPFAIPDLFFIHENAKSLSLLLLAESRVTSIEKDFNAREQMQSPRIPHVCNSVFSVPLCVGIIQFPNLPNVVFGLENGFPFCGRFFLLACHLFFRQPKNPRAIVFNWLTDKNNVTISPAADQRFPRSKKSTKHLEMYKADYFSLKYFTTPEFSPETLRITCRYLDNFIFNCTAIPKGLFEPFCSPFELSVKLNNIARLYQQFQHECKRFAFNPDEVCQFFLNNIYDHGSFSYDLTLLHPYNIAFQNFFEI